MTFLIETGFLDKYHEEIKIRAQQTKRKLDGAATEDGGMFIGDTAHFPRLGSVETYPAERLRDLSLANVGVSWLKKDCDPEFVAFGIWDPDKNKTTLNMAGAFAAATVRAVNRAQDRQHVEALNAAATSGVTDKAGVTENIQTIGDYNTVANLEMIVEAINLLGTNEMFEGESISIIAPFKLRLQNSLDPYVARSDVKGNRPWDELIWRSYERLPGNGSNGEGWLLDPKTKAATDATGVDIFVHTKSAVQVIKNDDPKEINERLGSKLGDMIGRWFQSSALVTEPSGVIRIKSKLDFDLYREPTPIDQI